MMRGLGRSALALVLAVACAGPVRTEGNSGLVRLDDRGDLLGWEAVGRVEFEGMGYCTGVLIATDLVLTAAHCVYDRSSGRRLRPDEIRFKAGWRMGTAIAERDVALVAPHPGYAPDGGLTAEQVRVDAALLKLGEPIPAAMAAPFVLHGRAGAGERVSVVSYGQGRSETLSWQRDCGLLGRGQGLMAFDCDVTFGSSGAPVFTRDGQRARILSLVSSGGTREGAPISFGMELPPVVADLKRELQRAGPVAGAGHAAKVRRLTVGGETGSARNDTGAKFVRPPGS